MFNFDINQEKIKGEEKAKEAKEERVVQAEKKSEQTAGRGRRSSKRKKPTISSVIDKDVGNMILIKY